MCFGHVKLHPRYLAFFSACEPPIHWLFPTKRSIFRLVNSMKSLNQTIVSDGRGNQVAFFSRSDSCWFLNCSVRRRIWWRTYYKLLVRSYLNKIFILIITMLNDWNLRYVYFQVTFLSLKGFFFNVLNPTCVTHQDSLRFVWTWTLPDRNIISETQNIWKHSTAEKRRWNPGLKSVFSTDHGSAWSSIRLYQYFLHQPYLGR